MPAADRARTLTLFAFDWDADAYARLQPRWPSENTGFDLFSFPSNLRLAGFDIECFVDALALRARRRGWRAVLSHHEQFGALAAALLAERLGLPGTPVEAVLACQHKLLARRALERHAPEANVPHALLPVRYGEPIPREGVHYPAFAKPVKAAFSVLARRVESRAELQALTRFSAGERWIIHRLVEPFDRVLRRRLPHAETAHRMLLEDAVDAAGMDQHNLDGWVEDGRVRLLGVIDAVMYPGTQAFMRWDRPSRLGAEAQRRALQVAERFLHGIGYRHGCFNMEFFHHRASGAIKVIEFNPRLASQFGDLYRRVDGLDPHALSLALAHGEPGREAMATTASAGAAASFVFRTFDPTRLPPMPDARRRAEFARRFPDGLLLPMPKQGSGLARDFKWLGNHRYGILHLGGRDADDLRARCEAACALLGWPVPYADAQPAQPQAAALPPRALELTHPREELAR